MAKVKNLGKSSGLTDRRELTISTGRTVNTNKISAREVSWSQFCARLERPKRTEETIAQYMGLGRDEQGRIKDVGYFVGGAFAGEKRKTDDLQYRDLITLDADFASDGFPDGLAISLDVAWCIYSTHKHTPEAPRYRLVLPTSRPIKDPDEYQAVARRVAEWVGIDDFDDTSYEPGRAMFWPSVAVDGEYIFDTADGAWLDVDAVLATYGKTDAWRDTSKWPKSRRVDEVVTRHAAKAGEPGEKPGLVGAFCRVHDIHSAIETYLSDKYRLSDADSNRYTYIDGTTSNGATTYDAKWLYSFHSTDPTQGQLCNAFDLVRIHKYGDRDENSRKATPVTELPSFKAMLDLARQDREVVREALADRVDKAFADGFDDQAGEAPTPGESAPLPEEKGPPAWFVNLEVDRQGVPKPTITNAVVVLENHKRLAGRVAYNELADQIVVRGTLPWRRVGKSRNGDQWTDRDEIGLRLACKGIFGVELPKPTVWDAVMEVAQRNAFNPVRDWLESLEWDGKDRLDNTLNRFLGIPASEYAAESFRRWMIAGVARTYRPGCKVDNMLMIGGPQGLGKSTFARLLALDPDWFGDNPPGVSQGKDIKEWLRGKLIVEFSELSSFTGKEVEHVKSFISSSSDRFRPAYGRHVIDAPRRCIFIGTTNEETPLKDGTGNRRYWFHLATKELDQEIFEAVVPQLWAEAVQLFKAGEGVTLTGETAREQAAAQQDDAIDDEGLAGMIEAWANEPVPADYDAEDPGGFAQNDEKILRPIINCREIFVECLGGSKEKYSRRDAIRITKALRKVKAFSDVPVTHRFGRGYGRQRGFVRVSDLDDLGL